jgi:hypothetical protein
VLIAYCIADLRLVRTSPDRNRAADAIDLPSSGVIPGWD